LASNELLFRSVEGRNYVERFLQFPPPEFF
jgi:hypothetical protein